MLVRLTGAGRVDAKRPLKGTALDIVGCVATALLVVAFGVLRLHFWHLTRPVLFSGDVGVVLEYIKNALQNGGTTVDPQVGWPNAAHLASFPVFDTLSAAALKAVSLVTADPVTGANLLEYVDHVASGVVGYLCFRALRIPCVTAVACAVSFAWIEFAMAVPRVFAHETLQLFAPVAIGVTVAMLPLARPEALGRPATWLMVVLGAVTVGLSQPYWTAFSAIALATAGAGYAMTGRWRAVAMVGAASAAMLLTTALCLAWPRLHGEPGLAIQRFPFEQPLYGLRLGDLLAPPRSAMAWLGDAYARYLVARGDMNEGTDAFVSWPGLIGLGVAAASLLLLPFRRRRGDSVIGLAALLIAVLVTFSLRHGLGEIFNALVTPEIRAQNRVSPMVAFLALFAFAAAAAWLGRAVRWPAAAQSLAVAIVVLGLIDQSAGLSYGAWQAEPGLVQRWNDAKADAAAVEALPKGTTILQLPLMPWPEGIPVSGMGSYDQMHLAIFTRGYRYGFGSAGDSRHYSSAQEFLDTGSPSRSVIDGAAYGYDEVLFYRVGYVDGGAAARQAVTAALHAEPNIDAPSFFGFDLRPLRGERLAPDLAADRVSVNWSDRGFSAYEIGPTFTYRWDDSQNGKASATINNPNSSPVSMRFCGTVVPGTPGVYQTTVELPKGSIQPATDAVRVHVDSTFDAPPGQSTISVLMPAPRLITAGPDPRHLHFQVRDPVLQPVHLLDSAKVIGQRIGIEQNGCR